MRNASVVITAVAPLLAWIAAPATDIKAGKG